MYMSVWSLEAFTAITWQCVRLNVFEKQQIYLMHGAACVFTFARAALRVPACSLWGRVSAETELWAANSILQHWDYVLF